MITDNPPPDTSRDNARIARQMLRAHRYGALSTLSKKFDGHPFGSIMPYLVDHDGSLLILISGLAEHTKNILADPRVSLITHNQDDPHIQAQGRVTLVGSAVHEPARDSVSPRYLRYFPEARTYFAMHDFQFYRIVPQALRYIGGFGNIHWVTADQYRVAAYPLIEQEDEILKLMNTEQEATLRRHTAQDKGRTELIGIDCDGFDIRAEEKILRIQSDVLILNAQQAMQQIKPA